MMLCAAGILAVTLAVLEAVGHGRGGASAAPTTGIPAPLAIGTVVPKPRRVPDTTLTDSDGKPYRLTDTHRRWTVLAPSMTLCREVCPMTTGALIELRSTLRRDGIAKQVNIVETTVDPWRDSPARLRAYQRRFGANFTMLTGSPQTIRAFWTWFGVKYWRVAEGKPPDIDWWTHQPEKFDVDHEDAMFIIDPHGDLRIVDVGMPKLTAKLPRALRAQLDSQGVGNLEHPEEPWTDDEVADDLLNMMGRTVARSQLAKLQAPSIADAGSQLRGSPRALAALHAQHGRLLGQTSALSARLHALRGHPIVLNVWASWCEPCREEFPLLATAAARYGREVAFVGADVSDPTANARSFLAAHPVSYPSYSSSVSALSALKLYPNGPPQTVFINARGKVVFVHDGEYQSLVSLENDIGQYGLGVTATDGSSG